MTFESFLREKHAKDYHGTDDDMVDAHEDWLCNKSVDDMIDLAEEWHAQEVNEYKAEILGGNL